VITTPRLTGTLHSETLLVHYLSDQTPVNTLSHLQARLQPSTLIATVTLTVTLADLSTIETKKPQHLQGFQRYDMAVREGFEPSKRY
jgi:hypothetical protein